MEYNKLSDDTPHPLLALPSPEETGSVSQDGTPHPLLALPSPEETGSVVQDIKQLVALVILAGLVVATALIFDLNLQNPTQRGLAPLAKPEVSTGRPVRIVIPAITVDAAFEYVGLAVDGVMDAPKSPDNVAWFEFGPFPGEEGSAVVAGHYGWKDGKAAVFDNLSQLQKGDKLYVQNDMGEVASFVVREIRSYRPYEDAADVFGSNDGKEHLNLITCEGIWDRIYKNYSQRLVVFTDKE